MANVENPQARAEVRQKTDLVGHKQVWIAGWHVLVVRPKTTADVAERSIFRVRRRYWNRKQSLEGWFRRVLDVHKTRVVDGLGAAFLDRFIVEDGQTAFGEWKH